MRVNYSFLFIIIVLIVAYYYNYGDILQKRPQSVHHWRQTDCASIALNYYKHGMHFFQPEVMFQISDGGTSGYTVGECPVFYYFIAILWKIFGYSDYIYRLVNMVIFFSGLFALHRITLKLTKDLFWSVVVPLILFVSPVVAYYANNFIMDTTSISLVFLGWLAYINYFEKKKIGLFYLAILLFTMAGLIKVSSLMSVIALIAIYALKTLNIGSRSISDFFKINTKIALGFVCMFGTIFLWYLFSNHYNKQHHAFTEDGSPYFSAQTFPIWNLSKRDIIDILKEIKNIWLGDYYHTSVMYLFGLLFLFAIIFFKRTNTVIRTMNVFLFVGVCLFVVLWFYAFGQHDYYIINLLIFPVFLLILFLEYLSRKEISFFSTLILKSVFVIFLLFNIHYTKGKLTDRYFGWQNEFPRYKDLHTITPYLREIGVNENDKVISLPDPATCYSLYLMNQPGWSATNFSYESSQVEKYISLGAKYLIISDPEIKNKPGLQSFLNNPVGEYGSVSIYKLQ